MTISETFLPNIDDTVFSIIDLKKKHGWANRHKNHGKNDTKIECFRQSYFGITKILTQPYHPLILETALPAKGAVPTQQGGKNFRFKL